MFRLALDYAKKLKKMRHYFSFLVLAILAVKDQALNKATFAYSQKNPESLITFINRLLKAEKTS